MFRLFWHYIKRGYGPRIAIRLARNRAGESRRIAEKMLKQNIFWGTK